LTRRAAGLVCEYLADRDPLTLRKAMEDLVGEHALADAYAHIG
jgi:hypothetical protein